MGYLWTIIIGLSLCFESLGQDMAQSELGFNQSKAPIADNDVYIILSDTTITHLFNSAHYPNYQFSISQSPSNGIATVLDQETGLFSYTSTTTNSDYFTFRVKEENNFITSTGHVFVLVVPTNGILGAVISVTNCYNNLAPGIFVFGGGSGGFSMSLAVTNSTTNSFCFITNTIRSIPGTALVTTVRNNICVDILSTNVAVQSYGTSMTTFETPSNSEVCMTTYLTNTLSEPLIPLMTSDNTPSGIASASGYEPGLNPYKAFDRAGDNWIVNSPLPQWLQYQFSSPVTATSYFIATPGPTTAGSPTAWTVSGSNNGSTWTVIDTQTGQTINNSTYFMANSTAYSYYRLTVTSCFSDYDGVAISQLQLYGH